MINRVMAWGYASDRTFRLLLVVLLVIGQFSLVLHNIDFVHHADGKECSVCLAAHGLDHLLCAGFMPAAVAGSNGARVAWPASFTVSRAPVRLVARSPPIHALHA